MPELIQQKEINNMKKVQEKKSKFLVIELYLVITVLFDFENVCGTFQELLHGTTVWCFFVVGVKQNVFPTGLDCIGAMISGWTT